jgi:hypothetical protein
MRQNCVIAKHSAGATDTLAIAQDGQCAVGGQTRIGGFQSAGPLTLVEGPIYGSGGDAWSTGGPPRGSKRSKEGASQAKVLERGARVIEVLAAAAQKRIKLAEIAMRMVTEEAVVNAAVEAFKLPLQMPANFRKLLQQRALKGLAGFDDAATSSAAALSICERKRPRYG